MEYTEFFNKYQIPVRHQQKLDDISPEDRERILEIIEREEKSVSKAFFYEMFALASSGYLGNWFIQILLWLYTFMMFSLVLEGSIVASTVWVLTVALRVVSIPKRVSLYNRKLFARLVRRVTRSRSNYSTPFSFSSSPRKKQLKIAYDPTEISVYHLQKGFLLDYMQSTWQVIGEGQYQWQGYEEKHFIIENDQQSKYLFFDYSATPDIQKPVAVFDQLAPYSLDSYYREVNGVQIPMSQINIGNEWMNQTYFQKGYFYEKYSQEGQILKCWQYANDTSSRFLRIEKYRDKGGFKVYLGTRVESYFFSEILPAAQ